MSQHSSASSLSTTTTTTTTHSTSADDNTSEEDDGVFIATIPITTQVEWARDITSLELALLECKASEIHGLFQKK